MGAKALHSILCIEPSHLCEISRTHHSEEGIQKIRKFRKKIQYISHLIISFEGIQEEHQDERVCNGKGGLG